MPMALSVSLTQSDCQEDLVGVVDLVRTVEM